MLNLFYIIFDSQRVIYKQSKLTLLIFYTCLGINIIHKKAIIPISRCQHI